jgi:hypothetical protein
VFSLTGFSHTLLLPLHHSRLAFSKKETLTHSVTIVSLIPVVRATRCRDLGATPRTHEAALDVRALPDMTIESEHIMTRSCFSVANATEGLIDTRGALASSHVGTGPMADSLRPFRTGSPSKPPPSSGRPNERQHLFSVDLPDRVV